MKRITVVCDDRDVVGVQALIEQHVQQQAMIPCRIIVGADLAEFTDDEVAQAARDRGFTFAHDL